MADFNDFGLILQDFGRPFRRNQLVLALQFSFKLCCVVLPRLGFVLRGREFQRFCLVLLLLVRL